MLTTERIRLVLCVIAGAALAAPALAQGIGFVDTQAAILGTAEIGKEQAAMEAKYKPQQDELDKMSSELQDIQNKLTSMAGKLQPDAERDMQAQGQRLQRDIQRKTEDLTAEIENYRSDVLGRVSERMRAVIQKLAEEKGLDAILDVTSAVYVKPSLDLTAGAIAAYNTAHPAQ